MTGVGARCRSILSSAMDSKENYKNNVPRELDYSRNDDLWIHGVSLQTPLANVIELLKVRLQVQRDNRFTMKGMFREVVRTNGVRALGRGLIPLMWRDSLGYACYFGFCETTLAYITPEHRRRVIFRYRPWLLWECSVVWCIGFRYFL